MKSLFTFLVIIYGFPVAAQNVGINTNTPAATLDVVGNAASTTLADGVAIPKLTGDQLKAKDAVYTAAQNGTIVYVTAAASPTTTKTANVTAAGFYYFDGSAWQRVASTTVAAGQLLNSVFIDNPTLSLSSNFQSSSFTNMLSYSYTPVSSNSKIMVQYHNNNYTISGGWGPDADEFQTQLLIPASVTVNTQLCSVSNSANSSFRTGSLFPIAGVADNSGTAAITIRVQIRKSSGDDYFNISQTNGTLIIQEIAR